MPRSTRRMWPAGWAVTSGQPRMVTLPPATMAAARNGIELTTSGWTVIGWSRSPPGCTYQVSGPASGPVAPAVAVSTRAPASRSICTVISMCGAEGARPPRCRTSRPLSYRGAASSSPETSCEEADASTVTAPPASEPVPCTVNGMAPRPPSSITAPISRSAAMIAPTGRCEARGSPWNSVSTLASADTGGTNRMTVPAFPTSTRASREVQPGVTRQAGPLGGHRGPQVRGGHPGHQPRVPGLQRAEDVGRPGGQGGEDEGPVGHGLRPGHPQPGPQRATGLRRGPGEGRAAGILAWRVHAVSVMRVLSAWPGVNRGNRGRTSERCVSPGLDDAAGDSGRMARPSDGGARPAVAAARGRCSGRGLVIKICGY